MRVVSSDQPPREDCTHSPRTLLSRLTIALAMAASLLGSAHPARAATFIVTTTDDGGAGSLRQAMLDANAAPGLDTISFNIPGDGVRVIAVTSALPEVTDPVIIDGYTQPGAAPNSLAVGSNAVILIELDGTAAGDAVNGFYLTSGGSTIRGLAITYFTYAGIEIDYGGANTIAGNHIGVDASGAVAKRNGVGTMWDGIVIGWISSSGANVIGGQAPADRNVISANEGAGIWMTATSGGNVIRGNYIGTNAAGTAAIANGQYGILLAGPGDEVIDNVISANAAGYPGILAPSAATGTIIRGNRIGTTADGTGALGNGGPGIRLESANNVVGGTDAGDANLIAHNAGAGVVVTAGNVGNAILGNSIHSNTGIGIDLGDNGVSLNNGSKSSTQANRGMDAAVFTAASVSGGQVTVAGYVGSQIGQSVFANARVEVFVSDTDASGYGEGRTYLGTVTTNAQGSFSGSLPVPGLTTGSRLTATATDTLNDTSEFGPQFVATNIAPVLTGANTLTSLSEDPVADAGTLVSALIATHTTDDGPGGVASGIAVTGVDNANGAWQYTIDGGTTWADFGSPSGTASRLLSATALTSVRFVPFAHWTGTVASGLTFRAWDQSTGTPGATADTTVTGGATAFSVATASASITVGAVNDAPTFVVGDGIVTTNVAGASMDFHQAVLVQPDGKIVAAGYTSTTTKDIVVARYNADGSLDTTFGGGDGIVVTPVGTSDDVANAIVRRTDGRLLVVGQTFNGSDTDVALVQLTSTGAFDVAFGGGDGIATSGLAGYDEGYDVALQADGRILVASQSSTNLQVVRFNADGTRDSTFGTGGLVEVDVASGNDRTYAIALDADGRILLAGSAVVGPNVDIVVVRLTDAGVLDTSFNGTGKVTVDIGTSSSDTGYAMTLQPDGRILVAGWSDAPGSTQFAVIRLTAGGSLDTTSGGDGTITVDVGTSSGSKLALDVVVQPDGRILVGGTGNSNGNNLGVVRLTAAGALDQSFGGGDGIVETTISTYSDERAQALALQADGRIVVAGTTNAPGNYDLLVARYTASGAIDVAFEGVDTLGGTVSYTENGPVLALDANVTVFDADLDSANSYGGATLTLARHGGASAEDLFSSTSMVMTPGGSLSHGGVAFATVTTNAGGTLVLTFNANATPALVTTALRSIGYRNSSDAPPPSVQIDWTFSDGNAGAQGPGSALSATGTTLVSIAPVNDAPVLTLVSGNANYPEGAGVQVVSSGASVIDTDSADFDGGTIVVWFSANGQADDRIGIASVASLGISVSGASVRYGGVEIGTASGGTNGSVPLTVTLNANATLGAVQALARCITYENTSEAPSTAVRTMAGNITDGDGGTSATASGTITVIAVNDAPTITSGAAVTLPATDEDSASSATDVSTILAAASWADADASPLGGIAITSVSGAGAWQFSTGGAWTSFGAVSATGALLLPSAAQVRYVGGGLTAETATFAWRAWDRTSGAASASGSPAYANPGSGGGSSAYSSQSATASMVVTAVNDAPVLSGVANLSAIDEDAIQNPGTPVATLVAGRISDAEGTNGLGIAITGIDSTNGSWQFTMGPGTTWQTLSAASDASALLLAADGGAAIRFVPASNWNGTVAAGLTIRAWDGTSGKAGSTANTSTNGGSTAFSSATASASITVTASNDAPTSANDAITVSATGAGLAAGSLRWSVDYLVDVSQPVLGESQATGPRDSRGARPRRDRTLPVRRLQQRGWRRQHPGQADRPAAARPGLGRRGQAQRPARQGDRCRRRRPRVYRRRCVHPNLRRETQHASPQCSRNERRGARRATRVWPACPVRQRSHVEHREPVGPRRDRRQGRGCKALGSRQRRRSARGGRRQPAWHCRRWSRPRVGRGSGGRQGVPHRPRRHRHRVGLRVGCRRSRRRRRHSRRRAFLRPRPRPHRRIDEGRADDLRAVERPAARPGRGWWRRLAERDRRRSVRRHLRVERNRRHRRQAVDLRDRRRPPWHHRRGGLHRHHRGRPGSGAPSRVERAGERHRRRRHHAGRRTRDATRARRGDARAERRLLVCARRRLRGPGFLHVSGQRWRARQRGSDRDDRRRVGWRRHHRHADRWPVGDRGRLDRDVLDRAREPAGGRCDRLAREQRHDRRQRRTDVGDLHPWQLECGAGGDGDGGRRRQRRWRAGVHDRDGGRVERGWRLRGPRPGRRRRDDE